MKCWQKQLINKTEIKNMVGDKLNSLHKWYTANRIVVAEKAYTDEISRYGVDRDRVRLGCTLAQMQR